MQADDLFKRFTCVRYCLCILCTWFFISSVIQLLAAHVLGTLDMVEDVHEADSGNQYATLTLYKCVIKVIFPVRELGQKSKMDKIIHSPWLRFDNPSPYIPQCLFIICSLG